MNLIIGGAYQGKTAYAIGKYGFAADDFFVCDGTHIDFTKPCITHLERFTLACVREGVDCVDYLESFKPLWQSTTFLCGDLSCGIVPMEAENRAWRNETGRLCSYLSRNAQRVVRIFCGLEQRLK